MTLRLAVASVLTLGLAGCAHSSLEGSDLDKVQHPAFVSRVADEAGPRVNVYRSDSTQAAKLGATSPADADRKLEESLKPALSRFEAAERLRSHVQAAIQTEKPWSQAVPPSQVASALETFLVQEVPGSPPDYGRLKPLGADSVVEFVIEEYGVRTEKGVPQTWVRGTGRMFRLGDGGELWRSGFSGTSTEAGLQPLDPGALSSNPRPFHEQMVAVLDSVSVRLARQLSPTNRAGGGPTPPGTGELRAPPDERTPLEKELEKSKAQPPPDATSPTDVPVDVNSKKKPPRESAPPPDATAPTEVPVDSKKK
ncbi:MAG TPA: hypothetical protein VFN91_11095 [Myxococcaceae bacterium]|nr:hypothetical protein [Myxococcaceae bacterium]